MDIFRKVAFTVLAIVGSLVSFISQSAAVPIVDGMVTFNSGTSSYTYKYVVSGVDPGRKVTGIGWVVLEGVGAPQPDFLPLSWSVPYFWNFLPGHDGPVPGGVWQSGTGGNDGVNDFPVDPSWGILLAGQTRTFSFTTGYGPRFGTYFLVENADGSEVNYNFLTGTTVVPDFTGGLAEVRWVGQDTLNRAPWNVPEPSTIMLLLSGSLIWCLIGHRSTVSRSFRVTHAADAGRSLR